jgi:hypothetical protein
LEKKCLCVSFHIMMIHTVTKTVYINYTGSRGKSREETFCWKKCLFVSFICHSDSESNLFLDKQKKIELCGYCLLFFICGYFEDKKKWLILLSSAANCCQCSRYAV